MLVEVQMPELGAEVTEGTLLAWLVGVGESVSAGDPIAELETDKATMELESEVDGVLREILVAEGSEGVQVGAVLAKIDSLDAPAAVAKEGSAAEAPVEAAVAAAGPAAVVEAAAEVAASPLARRLASQAGLDLAGLAGSGARGRILRADVDALSGEGAAESRPAPAPQAKSPESGQAKPSAVVAQDAPVELLRHSAMRRTIARRLSESKQSVPHFYLRVACRVDELMRVRKTVNAADDAVKISVNDFVLRAVALSLREVPAANVSWTDEAMIQYQAVDVSVAVATDGGLITPVLRDADRKGLAAISQGVRELALRARDGKLRPEEYQGGSFTVSNLGMYGIETVYPIVNPPQACILGVGSASEQPVVNDGRIEVGHVMMCTLSADHRAVDGAVGAQFLSSFQRFIEDPVSMIL